MVVEASTATDGVADTVGKQGEDMSECAATRGRLSALRTTRGRAASCVLAMHTGSAVCVCDARGPAVGCCVHTAGRVALRGLPSHCVSIVLGGTAMYSAFRSSVDIVADCCTAPYVPARGICRVGIG